MRQDKQKELTDKKLEEARQYDLQKDPICPGCKQRLYSQGCACAQKKGGGKRGDSDDSDKDESKELDYLTRAAKENTSWSQGLGDKFNFKSVKGLLSIYLDFHGSNLTFKTDKVLSPEDHAVLEKYITDVKAIFNAFCEKNGLVLGKDFQIEEKTDMDDNYSLVIRFSDKENFNAFVSLLFQEKMLPTPSNHLANVLKPRPGGNKNLDEDEQDALDQPEKNRSSPFSLPNPFDIDSGPKKE